VASRGAVHSSPMVEFTGTGPELLKIWGSKTPESTACRPPRPFVAMLIQEMRDQDGGRRDEVLQTLLLITPPEAVSLAPNSWDSACKGDFSASH